MPFADPEKRKEYDRNYRLKNKEKIKLKNQKWRQNNKEYIYETHKEYNQTEKGHRVNTISNWKYRGIIFHDYDLLYEIYLQTTHCDKCKDLLSTDKKKNRKTKCLDHNHFITDSYNIRNVLCHACNNIDKVNNKSSVPNIRWREERKCWTYGKTINKERHQTSFKYFIQAVIYKKEFETDLIG